MHYIPSFHAKVPKMFYFKFIRELSTAIFSKPLNALAHERRLSGLKQLCRLAAGAPQSYTRDQLWGYFIERSDPKRL